MSRILFWCASLAHVLGALEVLGYNMLLRRALGQAMATPVVRAGILFILFTSLLGAVVGRHLTRKAALEGRSVLFLPLVRASISAFSWLSSIPVLAVVAIRTQGHVHPIGFPHFVASVVIACLISTIYSSICNLWISLEIARERNRDVEERARLEGFLRLLPVLASAIPLVATGMYLFFFRPWTLVPGTGKSLEYLLVAMIALGCYGTLLCRWAARRMRERVVAGVF